MARLTKNGYKRKMIVFGAFLFMSIALTVTGFAAWVMSTNAKSEGAGNVEVGVVAEGNLTIALDDDVKFGNFSFEPVQGDTSGRVRQEKDPDGEGPLVAPYESLSLTISGKVGPVEYLDTFTCEIILPQGFAKAVELNYIVLPEGTQSTNSDGTISIVKEISLPAGAATGEKEFEVTIEFGWGSAFQVIESGAAENLNPSEYFDHELSFAADKYPDTAEGNANVKKVLEDLRACVYNYYEELNADGANREDVINAHKDDVLKYKVVLTATAN